MFWQELTIFERLISKVDIIKSKSGEKMNGKPHLRHDNVSMSGSDNAFWIVKRPSAFMRLMTEVLKPPLRECVVVYFDDVLIFNKTQEQHLKQDTRSEKGMSY